uniref:Uncharacterized protein n=1 Tax=Arundo donax TaxID=35708 RepID=A0A0A9C5X9_ARUDO
MVITYKIKQILANAPF